MKAPEIPDDEGQRLVALQATGLLFSPTEERFDRITRLAVEVLHIPIALVTLVADKCQWFKSAQGLDATETPREVSFCGHAILDEETLVVGDASRDSRFVDNPLVTGDPKIRFYAGHPLHTVDGSRVGTLCVIDRAPRRLSVRRLRVLRDLAAIAETELQRGQLNESVGDLMRQRDALSLKASIDGLTRVWNRSAILDLLAADLARAKRGVPMCVAMLDVDHFKQVNDRHGHAIGDAVLVEIAARIRRALRSFDAVGRVGGEEFIAVLSNCPLDLARTACERIRATIANESIDTPAGPIKVTVSIGLVAVDCAHHDLESLVTNADAAMYVAKKNGRNRVEWVDPAGRETSA